MYCFSQDALPFKSIKHSQRNISKSILYDGKILKINKYSYIRARLYKKEFLQVTYIQKYKRLEFRGYAYFSLLDRDITPAISIRYNF